MNGPAREEERDEASEEQMNLGGMLGIALAAVVGTTLTVWAWHFMSPEKEEGHKPAAAAAVPRVALLPFHSLSGKPDDERLDKGLTNALVGELAKISQVHVLPSAAFADPVTVGRELGARVMIIGLVERPDGRIKVKVQMISARDGRQIWAGGFDGNSTDIGGLSAHISESVASHLTALLD